MKIFNIKVRPCSEKNSKKVLEQMRTRCPNYQSRTSIGRRAQKGKFTLIGLQNENPERPVKITPTANSESEDITKQPIGVVCHDRGHYTAVSFVQGKLVCKSINIKDQESGFSMKKVECNERIMVEDICFSRVGAVMIRVGAVTV